MAIKILRLAFYTLFVFTPLLFTPYNNELFEFNKMLLVYGLTVVVIASWLYQMLSQRRLIFKRTILDIPLVIFFLSQILSTFFSIDPHTSIWGYYSRLNGGLLSITSYLLLYWAFVSNIDAGQALRFLKSSIIGGAIVALWAIPEHFGYSPSCALLVGRWAADCWVQDVQARVFATLGQPNWLAAYMGMLFFPGIYFFLTEKVLLKKLGYYLATLAFYLAFTFTFSRGGMLGIVGALGISGALVGWEWWKRNQQIRSSIKPLVIILAAVIVINLLFGSALTGSFRLLKENAPPPRPGISSGGGTQLENGGTESGQIRLIVWQGAIEIFKHYPIFGSGVETFAYSYYMFRPIEHNMVSEWDFLYNKAHNEYLNYLATTGIVGFISYLAFIATFIIWSFLRILNYELRMVRHSSPSNHLERSRKITNFKLQLHKHESTAHFDKLLVIFLLASYLSYLIQNFFGFSVVIIAVLFYLIPAFVFVMTTSTWEIPSQQRDQIPFLSGLGQIIVKRTVYVKILKIIIILLAGYLLLSVFNLWRADVNYKIGSDAADAGSATRAYNSLLKAYDLNPYEPLYQSDFGNVAASAAVALVDTDATQAAELKDQAIAFTSASLLKSPANVSLWRTAIRTYYVMSVLDSQFDTKTIETIDQTIKLAPTDPKLYYNKSLILSQQNKNDLAIEAMQKAVELKPNYKEARLNLADLYLKNKQPDQALAEINFVLKQIPNDPDALERLKDATEAATQ